MTIADVEVWSYYDGIISGTMQFDGKTCHFELASGSNPISDDARRYIVIYRGKVITTVTESQLREASKVAP